jgi:hypothetical protein
MDKLQGRSAPTKTTPRDTLLEYQIRHRDLSFAEAKKNNGYCCLFGIVQRLRVTGYCGSCTDEQARGDCACTRTECCAYHDRATHYCCGVSILKPHDSLCREARRS